MVKCVCVCERERGRESEREVERTINYDKRLLAVLPNCQGRFLVKSP